MARLIMMLCLVATTVACTQNPVKDIQATLDMQLEADRYYAQDDCVKAVPLYKSLAAAMPADTNSLLRIGNCFAKEKDYQQAEQAYQHALIRDKSFIKAWHNLSYIRAQILAETVMNMYKQVDPDSPQAEKIRKLTQQVLTPFDIKLDELNAVQQ